MVRLVIAVDNARKQAETRYNESGGWAGRSLVCLRYCGRRV